MPPSWSLQAPWSVLDYSSVRTTGWDDETRALALAVQLTRAETFSGKSFDLPGVLIPASPNLQALSEKQSGGKSFAKKVINTDASCYSDGLALLVF